MSEFVTITVEETIEAVTLSVSESGDVVTIDVVDEIEDVIIEITEKYGIDGEDFKYEDFTPAQLLALKGDKGDPGTIDYDDLENKPGLADLQDDSEHRTVSDTEKGTWNGKQGALVFTPEDSANKISSFQVTPDDIHYPTEKLVKDSLDDKLSAEITSPVIDQIVKFNGTDWVNGNPNPVSAGAGVDFFQVPVPSDIEEYALFSKTPADFEEMSMPFVVNNNKVSIGGTINPTTLDVTTIDAGIWIFHTWANVDISGHTQLVYDVYKRSSAGVETLLFSAVSEDLEIGLAQYDFSTIQQGFTLLATDRLVIKLSIQTTNVVDTTVSIPMGGTTHYSYISTPLITKHNELSGLQGGAVSEMYHLSQEKYNVVQNTSGVNTGDQDLSGKADINFVIAMSMSMSMGGF
jgi:hypothetical protein